MSGESSLIITPKAEPRVLKLSAKDHGNGTIFLDNLSVTNPIIIRLKIQLFKAGSLVLEMKAWNSEVRNLTRRNIDSKDMQNGLICPAASEVFLRNGDLIQKHLLSWPQEDGVVGAGSGHNIDLVLQTPAFKTESDAQKTKDQEKNHKITSNNSIPVIWLLILEPLGNHIFKCFFTPRRKKYNLWKK